MLQRIALPAAFAARRSTSARNSSRVRVSLKRMLKRARASAGMRLTVLLPISIEVNSRFDGPKCAVPLSSGSALIAPISATSPRTGLSANSGYATWPCVPVTTSVPFCEPRRPILIMSPSFCGLVGSPRMQWSNFSPRAAAHCSSLTVPLTAMPSSSPVIRNEIEPFGLPSLAAR